MLTQKQLAQKMKTSQSAIARLESGESNPSISLLKRYASATGTQLKVELLA
jgi:transcriptional regulator with XRE-family HTH domain